MYKFIANTIKKTVAFVLIFFGYTLICGFTQDMGEKIYKAGFIVTISGIIIGLASFLINGGGGNKWQKLINRIAAAIFILIMIGVFLLFFVFPPIFD